MRFRSAAIAREQIFTIAAGDDHAWRAATVGFKSASLWDSRTGHADPRDARIMNPIVTETWLACWSRGDQRRSAQIAREKMMTFVAVTIATHFDGGAQLLTHSAANPVRTSTQFPADGTHTGVGYMISSLGTIVPPLGDDLTMTDEGFAETVRWYDARAAADAELSKRASVASHFIHHGLIRRDLERFIHFFVALDALFGVRGDVERAIIAGVDRVFGGDPNWKGRARQLFNLRSEILHGGASSIETWPGFSNYDRHFKTDPIFDVAKMALRLQQINASVSSLPVRRRHSFTSSNGCLNTLPPGIGPSL